MALVLRDRLLASPAASRPLDPSEMLAIARGVDLDRLDLAAHREFCDTRYARNTVFMNEHIELVVICWLAKQASSIHDHGRSQCLYLIVEGTMQEEMFELDAAGKPRRLRAREFTRGQITIAAPTDVHRICNVGADGLVTLHLYSPPLDEAVRNFTPIPTYRQTPQST
jgi:predicted metal-dependent enzyme (double-stranded beta helix superfamily)